MAEVVPEKSRGLKFAEQQLLRHGWEQGKGLGRAENGISEAIKVKVKCDKGGVGHREGEQFTFHWWDHVFNKASSSLQVASDQDGVTLKRTEEEEDGAVAVSNKKPRRAALQKDKLYGCFVKSATLLSGREQPEPRASHQDDEDEDGSSSSSDEEDERRLDLSSTTKLSDSDLMKVCGGRTAHKGARHGLTMSAKLARLEQQEAEFMAKWGKKDQSGSGSTAAQQEAMEEEQRSVKKKKKKKKSAADSPETHTQPKKKRKGDDACVENGDEEPKKKRKKKKKKEGGEEAESAEGRPEEEEEEEEKKKKKKKSAQSSDAEEGNEEEEKHKRKKCKKDKTAPQEEAPPPRRRKKKKKSRETA